MHWIILGVAYCSNTTQSWPLLMLLSSARILGIASSSGTRTRFIVRVESRSTRCLGRPLTTSTWTASQYFVFYRTALICGCAHFKSSQLRVSRRIFGNSHHIALWFAADQILVITYGQIFVSVLPKNVAQF
jgi:hypothetical protein